MTAALRLDRSSEVLRWLAPILGCVVLVLRPLGGVPSPDRVLVLAASSAAVAALALAVPGAGAVTDRMGAPIALAVGGAALAAAVILAGPRIGPRADAAALALSVGAALAEELLFRRALFARLVRAGPAVAIVGSALAFAAVHVPAYGWAAFPADLGAGLLFGWQRQVSGTWTVPAATHALANVIGGMW